MIEYASSSPVKKYEAPPKNSRISPTRPKKDPDLRIVLRGSAPENRFDGSLREEHPADDHREEVNEALRLDDPGHHLAEVLGDGEIAKDRSGRLGKRIGRPRDDEEEKQHHEAGHRGDDLV